MRQSINIFILITLLSGCIKQKPQLPANKNIAADSTHLYLQLANEKLISHEDSLLNEYVKNDSIAYIKDKNGYWYYIFDNKNNTNETKWKTAKITYSTYSLNNENEYFNKSENIKFGKTQLIATLDELVKKMNPGDSAIAIAPWYLAYGLKGEKNIPPYTSIKISLSLKQIH